MLSNLSRKSCFRVRVIELFIPLQDRKMSRMTFTSAPKKAEEVNWNEVDIDELVERLTPGEIQKLLEEFDPDDPHLPASERCAYKCDKLPTGPLNRYCII